MQVTNIERVSIDSVMDKVTGQIGGKRTAVIIPATDDIKHAVSMIERWAASDDA